MVPLLDELSPLGRSLATLDPVTVSASTALLYDEECDWAWQSPHLPARLDYQKLARRWHAALPGPVDVLPVSAPLTGYALVVVPALYLMSAETHAALRAYVRGGGTLVVGFGSGLVDECLRTTPGALDDLIGASVARRVPLPPSKSDGLCRFWFESLSLAGASALLSTEAGEPVVTAHGFGAGVVRYAATDLDVGQYGTTLFGGPP